MNPPKRFRQVYLEITNICNLSCNFCPGTERLAAFMNMELFRRIIPQLPELTEQVYFHVMGEPLLHPDFTAMVELCSEHSLPVAITTNGSRFDSPAAETLKHPGIRQVNISLHSLYPEIETETGNRRLTNIFNWIRSAMSQRPDLYINLRLWNMDHLHDKPSDRNLWLLQQIRTAFPEALPADELSGGHKSRRLLNRLYLNFDTVFEWPEISNDVSRRDKGYCHGLCHQLGILVDGTVVPCCLDRNGLIVLGNVTHQSLRQILNSPRSVAMLDGLKHGILVEELCQHCTFSRRFKPEKFNLEK